MIDLLLPAHIIHLIITIPCPKQDYQVPSSQYAPWTLALASNPETLAGNLYLIVCE